jgi:hypothetical protein
METMVGQTMNDMKARIIKQMVGSCSCMTKTPIPEYHEDDCLYRVLGDCLHMIENPRDMVYHILGQDLTERLIKDQYNSINDLDDPWQEDEYSCRVGLRSTKFAVEILSKLCDVLKPDFLDLSSAIEKHLDEIPSDAVDNLDRLMEVYKHVTDNWKPSKF